MKGNYTFLGAHGLKETMIDVAFLNLQSWLFFILKGFYFYISESYSSACNTKKMSAWGNDLGVDGAEGKARK